MNAGAFHRLSLKNGEEPKTEHLRQLDAAIAAQQSLSGGRNVRHRWLPWGVHTHYDASGGIGTSPYFAPSVASADGGAWNIIWRRGTIGGAVPTIAGKEIGVIDPATDGFPVFTVAPDKFNALGECYVYFRLFFKPTWFVEKIEPIAVDEMPQATAWRADRLALILYSDGTVWRDLVTNQGHMALNRRSNGMAQHIFWGKF